MPKLGEFKSFDDKFWPKVAHDLNGGCWLWAGSVDKRSGYAIMVLRNERRQVHRLAYERLVGPIPAGLWIDHKCRVRCCVNPDHLRAVTPTVNVLENSVGFAATNAAKTHCDHGHEFTAENTRIHRPAGRPAFRSCKACQRERVRAWRSRNHAR